MKCACGCGTEFRPRIARQRYANSACQARDYMERGRRQRAGHTGPPSAEVPSIPESVADLPVAAQLACWTELKRAGLTRAQAAERLGIPLRDLTRAETRERERARRAELDRANTQPTPWTADEALTEWDLVLRPAGCSYEQAADRLGMVPATLENHIARARAAGDERAKPPIPTFGGLYGPKPRNLLRDPTMDRTQITAPGKGLCADSESAEEQARERVALIREFGDRDRSTVAHYHALRQGITR